MEHYRRYQVYTTQKRGEIVVDTDKFFPHDILMLENASTNKAIHAVSGIVHVLCNLDPVSLFHKFGDETLNALHKLAEIYTCQSTSKQEAPNSKLRTTPLRVGGVKTT